MKHYRVQPWPGDFQAIERVFLPDGTDGACILDDVQTPPSGAVALTAAQYATRRAALLAAINAIPPVVDTELVTIQTILDKADADVTAAELKTLVLAFLRRLRRRGLVA